MSALKIFLFVSIFLIFAQCVSYSQEKTEISTTQKGAGRAVLIFPSQGVDKEVLDIFASNLPQDAFSKGGSKDSRIAYTPAELGNTPKYFVTELDSLINAFKEFKVDQIELWVQVAAESGGVLRLVASAKGEAGMRIVLKPKP